MVFGLFGPSKAERDAERAQRKWEDDQNDYSDDFHNYGVTIGKTERQLAVDQQNIDRRASELSSRIREGQMIRDYEDGLKVQNFELNQAYRFYNQSILQADAQKDFNAIAEAAAREQQAVKFHEDMLGLAFDKGESILEYYGKSTGLKVDRHNALVQADLKEAKGENDFKFGIAQASEQRRKARSQSQINTQRAILEGMRAAGQMKARGGGGRSAVKTVLAVMAESGAIRAGIANTLMYAENAVDLDIAQLKDIQILDQTMVTAARDSAHMAHDVGMQVLDSTKDLDNLKFDATEISIKRRNELVKKQITNSRMQADLNADRMIRLEPSRTPELRDPRVTFAMFDDPETEDYIEMLPRTEFVDIPEYVEPPRPPEVQQGYRAPGFNFGNLLTTVGTAAAAIGTGGAALAASGGSLLGMTAAQASYWTMAGTAAKQLGGMYRD